MFNYNIVAGGGLEPNRPSAYEADEIPTSLSHDVFFEEGVGFEPTVTFTVQQFSRLPQSTTLSTFLLKLKR